MRRRSRLGAARHLDPLDQDEWFSMQYAPPDKQRRAGPGFSVPHPGDLGASRDAGSQRALKARLVDLVLQNVVAY